MKKPRRTRAEFRPTAQRRLEIIEASIEILNASGVAGWTAAKVGARIGLTPPGLFKHFGGKDEIINAALAIQAARLREWVLAYKPTSRGWPAVDGLVRHILAFLERTGGGPFLALVAGEPSEEVRRSASETLRNVKKLVRSFYNGAKRAGNETPDEAAAIAIAIVHSSMLRWLIDRGAESPSEIAEPMLGLLGRRLGASSHMKGRT